MYTSLGETFWADNFDGWKQRSQVDNPITMLFLLYNKTPKPFVYRQNPALSELLAKMKFYIHSQFTPIIYYHLPWIQSV